MSFLHAIFKRRSAPKAPQAPSHAWALDEPMIRLTASDWLSARDLFEGTLVIGNPGSGKTSTSGAMLALAALRAQWGVAAYTTKPDDAAWWIELCRKAGRLAHLRLIRPDGQSHFNLIRYELERPSPGGGNTLKAGGLLFDVLQEGRPKSAPTDSGVYFENAGRMLVCNCLDLFRLAHEPASFRAMGALIASTPKSPEELDEPRWRESYCYQLLRRAYESATTEDQRELEEVVSRYFLHGFPSMNERTRGDVISTVEASLFQLNRQPFRTLLDSPRGCSFVPEMLDAGAVLLIDCPPGVHGPVGQMLTTAFKRVVKEHLRRRAARGDQTRPVMQFADECQTFVTRDDADFQQVCRSGRTATVFLTQSFDNIEAVLGNDAHTNSLAGALTTHIYHCTSGKTALWIQERIAQVWREMESVNYPGRSGGQYQPPSFNRSEALHPQVLASELARLRTGGPFNRRLVDAVVFKPGRLFRASGAPFVRVQFQQE